MGFLCITNHERNHGIIDIGSKVIDKSFVQCVPTDGDLMKMVVRFLFKKVIPSVFIYYGGIQMYLLYHLYRSDSMIRTPNTPAIYPQWTRRHLVNNVLAMYQCRATHQSFQNFATDVQFEDPAVYIEGLDSVKNTAFLMRNVMKGETVSLVEYHFEDQFILELQQKYTIFGLEMTIPSVVYVELETKAQEQKVKRFQEEWYGKAMITPDKTPLAVIGRSAQFFRGIHGRLFNAMKFEPPKE